MGRPRSDRPRTDMYVCTRDVDAYICGKMALRQNLLQNVSLLQALPRQHFVLVNVYDFYSVHADSRS